MNIVCYQILEVRAVSLVRLESQRCNYRLTYSKLTESEVTEHRTDVLILEITTKLLESDHRLGQLAVFRFLTRNIDWFRLSQNFTDNCLHKLNVFTSLLCATFKFLLPQNYDAIMRLKKHTLVSYFIANKKTTEVRCLSKKIFFKKNMRLKTEVFNRIF